LEAVVVLLLDRFHVKFNPLFLTFDLSDFLDNLRIFSLHLFVCRCIFSALVLMLLPFLVYVSMLIFSIFKLFLIVLNLQVCLIDASFACLHIKLMLFLHIEEFLELILELVHTLTCALVVLGDTDRLLGFLHVVFLLLLDLTTQVLLTRVQLSQLLFHLVVRLRCFLHKLVVLFKLLFERLNLSFPLLDERLKMIAFVLLGERKI